MTALPAASQGFGLCVAFFFLMTAAEVSAQVEWTRVQPAGQRPNHKPALVFDEARGRMLRYGGNEFVTTDETWEWDGSAWTQLDPASNPGERESHAMVYNVARRICRTAEDAEDVLQETFLEVCRSIGTFRGQGPGRLTAWVKRIVSSKALMRVRREKYRQTEEFFEDGPGAGRHGTDVGLRMDLENALSRLSDTSRAVVWLHDVEGYTHEDIAEMMGKTVSFSKSQLARAHARLRTWLGEEVSI